VRKPKIEDFIAYYIGGRIHTGATGLATNLGLFYKFIPGELGDVDPEPTGITLFFKQLGNQVDALAVVKIDSEEFAECKLALRPLSHITEEEAIFIAKEVLFNLYTIDHNQIRAQRFLNNMWLISYIDASNPLKVTITPEGQIGVFDPEESNYKDISFKHVHRLTPWMLKQQLDIFNLIKAGVALDITQLNKPNPINHEEHI